MRDHGVVGRTRVPSNGDWFALLHRPGYPGFVLTVSLSRVATPMFVVSSVLLVLARTHSATLAGATAAAATLPSAISGPLLGAWLDVARRRRVLIVADQLLSAAGLTAIVALTGNAPTWSVPVAAMLYSFTTPISTGSFVSTLAEVAGDQLLDRASAVEATSVNLGFIVGPALAGVLAGAFRPAAAIECQTALVLIVAALIAVNPVFESRPAHRPTSFSAAVREGTRALRSDRRLRRIGLASILGNMSWSLMVVGFPLLAAERLHAGAHAGGYMWAAVAGGSILGTFALPGGPSPRRVAVSYLMLGASALLWPVAGSLLAGFLLVMLSGILEGPAFSGVIALRQRYTPAAVRGQVFNTLGSLNLTASAIASALGGVLHRPLLIVLVFAGLNAGATILALRAGADVHSTRDTPA